MVGSFEIADEVISSRLYRSLLSKNRARLSARSYAYRGDLNGYDAIIHVQSEWRQEQRVFVAEYDFTDFFGSITHDHIWQTVDDLDITMTPMERRLTRAFLAAPDPYLSVAEKKGVFEPRIKGVMQGTSLSLFLANVAASPLDRALERLSVGFVRYADDTLIWSRDYSAICKAVEELHNISARIGSPINQDKSSGVRLLVSPETRRAEMPFTSEVSYLSHTIGLQSVRMKDSAEAKVRARIGEIIYNNLLREPLAGTQSLARVMMLDKDYIVCIWQLRRYLYGHLTENEVRRLQRTTAPMRSLSGAVARFPLINDTKSLDQIDTWIVSQLWLALRKRAKIINAQLQSAENAPAPWHLSRGELAQFIGESSRTGDRIDLRIPSTRRMAEVVHRAVSTHGTSVIGPGLGLYAARD